MFAIGGVVAVVVVMVGVSVFLRDPAPTSPGSPSNGTTEQVIAAATNVPATALDAVGAGEGISPPVAIPADTAPVTSDGKPRVLYIGAEYCPYCAAERWPLVVALSRFGTFSGLGLSTSSALGRLPQHADADVPWVHLHERPDLVRRGGDEHQSTHGFGRRVRTAGHASPSEQQRLMQTFNVPPYTSQAGVIPFLLIGNRFVVSGASYPPDVLQGKTWQQIADALSDPIEPDREAGPGGREHADGLDLRAHRRPADERVHGSWCDGRRRDTAVIRDTGRDGLRRSPPCSGRG